MGDEADRGVVLEYATQWPDGSYHPIPKTGLEWWDGNSKIGERILEQWDSWELPHRKWIVDHLGDASSLYEIGCGVGANLRLIQKYRPDIRLGASDGVYSYCEWVANHCNIHVEVEQLPSITAPRGPWDVVLVNYVLSYLEPDEAKATLQRIGQIAPKRVIILEPAPSNVRGEGLVCPGGMGNEGVVCRQWCHNWPQWCRDLGWMWQDTSRLRVKSLNLAVNYSLRD